MCASGIGMMVLELEGVAGVEGDKQEDKGVYIGDKSFGTRLGPVWDLSEPLGTRPNLSEPLRTRFRPV